MPKTFKEGLLASCLQNLQTLNTTFWNTDSFTLQCFLLEDFSFLNPTWDLKVGVPTIGNARFQGLVNDL